MGILDTVIRRQEWGAKYSPDRTLALGQKTEMHVHHTVLRAENIDKVDDLLRSVEADHHRQWGYSIGYNLLVDPWLRVWEGAGWLRRGQHCPNHNTSSFGVAFVGDGRLVLPYALDQVLDAIWDELSNRRGMRLYLYGHRDHRQTNCPGDTLYHEVHYKFPNVGPAPAPAPAPTPTPTPGVGLEKVMDNPVLTQGSEGQHVRILQGLLCAHAEEAVQFVSYVNGHGMAEFIDGVFGQETFDVLVDWQRRTEYLVPDGVAGPKTWNHLAGLPVA